jgi:hypothetical protein
MLAKSNSRFYGISGSWRDINESVECDVRDTISDIIKNWDWIISWWALGVDYIATQTVLDIGDPVTQLQIYLPISLQLFCDHYDKRAKEWIITSQQADMIITQLQKVHTIFPSSIRDETPYTEATTESYYARNTTIVESCDELYAFQVNDSQWVQDAIMKANHLSKPVHLKRYSIK